MNPDSPPEEEEEILLEYSDSKQPGTFHTEQCLWDMRNIFYCPKCGLIWQTDDFNIVMPSLATGRIEYPDVILLRCYRERDGCGFVGKVKFNYPKEALEVLTGKAHD